MEAAVVVNLPVGDEGAVEVEVAAAPAVAPFVVARVRHPDVHGAEGAGLVGTACAHEALPLRGVVREPADPARAIRRQDMEGHQRPRGLRRDDPDVEPVTAVGHGKVAGRDGGIDAVAQARLGDAVGIMHPRDDGDGLPRGGQGRRMGNFGDRRPGVARAEVRGAGGARRRRDRQGRRGLDVAAVEPYQHLRAAGDPAAGRAHGDFRTRRDASGEAGLHQVRDIAATAPRHRPQLATRHAAGLVGAEEVPTRCTAREIAVRQLVDPADQHLEVIDGHLALVHQHHEGPGRRRRLLVPEVEHARRLDDHRHRGARFVARAPVRGERVVGTGIDELQARAAAVRCGRPATAVEIDHLVGEHAGGGAQRHPVGTVRQGAVPLRAAHHQEAARIDAGRDREGVVGAAADLPAGEVEGGRARVVQLDELGVVVVVRGMVVDLVDDDRPVVQGGVGGTGGRRRAFAPIPDPPPRAARPPARRTCARRAL